MPFRGTYLKGGAASRHGASAEPVKKEEPTGSDSNTEEAGKPKPKATKAEAEVTTDDDGGNATKED